MKVKVTVSPTTGPVRRGRGRPPQEASVGGVWRTFWFVRGASCALEVKIEQDQKQGMQFRRAVWHDLCVAEERHDYCVAHGGLDISAADLNGIGAYVDSRCPTIQAMYLAEPHSGQRRRADASETGIAEIHAVFNGWSPTPGWRDRARCRRNKAPRTPRLYV